MPPLRPLPPARPPPRSSPTPPRPRVVGAAYGVAAKVQPAAVLATVLGAAYGAAPKLTVNAGVAQATGAAYDAKLRQRLVPDADIDAGGWATEPLWSKVNDRIPDGTVITATAT